MKNDVEIDMRGRCSAGQKVLIIVCSFVTLFPYEWTRMERYTPNFLVILYTSLALMFVYCWC